jgi:phage terminase large subunit GpA-like protein
MWTSGLCSPFVSFGQRAETYLAALQSGDQNRIQTAMNASFGECYSLSASGDVPEWQEIMERRQPYRAGEVPAEGLRLVMGVDVQKFSLVYVIRAFGSRGTSWLVDSGQLYGPTDDDDVWSALADLMMQPIGGMQIEKVFIDSGFRPDKPEGGNEHKVYEFCRRFAWLCSPTKGRAVQSPPYKVSKIEVKPDGKRATYSINLVWLSSDFFKSLVVSRIRTPAGAAGAFYVHDGVTEDYCKQLTSEARIVVEGKPRWVRRAKANHFLDCEALCAAIGYALNVQRIPDGVSRAGDDDREPVSADAADGDALPPPSVSPSLADGGGSLRSRFANIGHRLNR